MIFLTIVITILPNYKVNALTGNDNNYYPNKPRDGYTDFIVYTDINSSTKGTYIMSFNKTKNVNVYTGYMSGGMTLAIVDITKRSFYSDGCITDFKKYKLNNIYENKSDWNWEEIDTIGKTAITNDYTYKILYSTVDIYYTPGVAKTTYSEATYLIPGEHNVPSNISYDEKLYYDKTYNKNTNEFEKEIVMSITDLYVDNVSKAQVTFNFNDYYDNSYKYYVKPQGKEAIDVTEQVLNGNGYATLIFEKSTKLVAQVLRNQSDLGINKVFDVKVKILSNKFESNDGESYPDKPEDGYTDFIVYTDINSSTKGTYIMSFNKTKNVNVYTGYMSGGMTLAIVDITKRSFYSDGCITDFKKYKLNNIYENKSDWNWEEIDTIGKTAITNDYTYKILYSTVDIYYTPGVAKTTYSEATYLIPGEHNVPSNISYEEKLYYDKTYNKNIPIKSSSIRFEDNVVNDLDNRNVNLLKVNFNDIYNSNYKYQISFDNKNWIDVTDTIIANDNHYIIYSLMSNTTIYAKVLSQDNEEIDTNNKKIDNLNDYQLFKSVSSTDTLNIYSIDFRLKNIQNTMGYEHYTTKIKLQYGSNDHTNKNRPYYLDYSITGLDENGMELNEDLTDYYNVQINDNEYYLGDYESFLYYDLVQIKPLLPNKVKQLKVSFYFSNLDNYYIHCYTTNTKSQTEIRFTESLFKDYVLYQFPSGFDYALIRPKSFQTSNGSLIADAYYFNSGILEMTTFDFKNNDISTIFDTTMDKSDYLIEGNNVKFNFTSDEDNNVYPALYLRKEVFCNIEIGYNDVLFAAGMRSYFCVNEKKRIPSATFYVHKDFYIEFINKNTLETKVVNIDKGDFEDKNNLELTQDFKDKVNEKYPEEEASSLGDIGNFINNLKESFLGKFKFIGQLKEIYDIFNTNISEDTEPPNWTINVEFKPLGIKYENLKVIDFSFFEEYKELLFNFEKLFLSTFTIVGIVRNIKKGSD